MDLSLLQALETNAFFPTGQSMCVYGNPAYPLRIHLQAPFRRAPLTPMMEDFNACTSSVRSSVEWFEMSLIISSLWILRKILKLE